MNVAKAKEISSVRNRVAVILASSEEARNSDTRLLVEYYGRYHGVIALESLDRKDLPKPSTVERSRRYWQNKKKMYLPKDKVAELREENQTTFEQMFGGM